MKISLGTKLLKTRLGSEVVTEQSVRRKKRNNSERKDPMM